MRVVEILDSALVGGELESLSIQTRLDLAAVVHELGVSPMTNDGRIYGILPEGGLRLARFEGKAVVELSLDGRCEGRHVLILVHGSRLAVPSEASVVEEEYSSIRRCNEYTSYPVTLSARSGEVFREMRGRLRMSDQT